MLHTAQLEQLNSQIPENKCYGSHNRIVDLECVES